MDAAHTMLKKSALLVAIALLMAATGRADAPAFVINPSSGTVVLDAYAHGSAIVTSSQTPGTEITFTKATAYTAGDPDWLSVSATGSATPVTLYFQPGFMGGGFIGTHTATVTLHATDGSGAADAVITVQYTTGGAGGTTGIITPSSNPIVLSAASGATTSQQVNLTTASSAAITFSVQAQSSGWLGVIINGGVNTVSSGQSASLTVMGSGVGLANGRYDGSIVITPGGNSPITVPVQFYVGGGGGGSGTLSANPSTVTWSYNSGGSAPAQQGVTLTSSTLAGTCTASASSTNNWLLVNSSTYISGQTLSSGLTLSASSNLTSLVTGYYTGTVTVVASDGASTTITVNLTVNSGTSTGLTLSTNSVTLAAAVGGFIQQQTITVTSQIAGTLYLSVSTNSGVAWLTYTANASSIGAGGQATVWVYANPAGLSAGTYSGSLTVQVQGTTTLTATIPVTFVVGTGGGTTVTGVAPNSLAFSYQFGTSAFLIFPQYITIAGATTGTFTASSSQGWLLLGTTAGTIPTNIAVQINPNGLAVGPYNGSITVTTPSGTQVISVALTVVGAPVLAANPAALIFDYQSGGSNPGAQVVSLMSSDNSSAPLTILISASAAQNWVAVTAFPSSLVVSVSPAGLAGGVYSGAVTIVSSLANSPMTIPVVLVVNGGAGAGPLTLSTSALTFTGVVSGTAPSAQTLTVSAASVTGFTAGATTQSGNWLTISPSGYLATNTSILVYASQTGLAVGTYTGTISLATSTATQTVPVTLVVTSTSGGGNVTTTPSSLSFAYQVGGTTPASQTLSVSNTISGTASISFTVGAATQSGGIWLGSNVLAASTPATLSISVTPTGLAAGTYTGTITITPSGGTAVSVPVTLTVTAPTVSATPTTLNFSYRVGDANPAAQTVQVAGGGAALSFLASASSTGNWLSVSPTTGTTGATPVNLSASVSAANLGAGTFTGTITVSGTNGATGTTTITVTITVTAPLPTITRVTNAASYAAGSISPGLIITMFGTAIGPATAAYLTVDPTTGKVATTIGGVQVLVNGFSAPMVFANSTQVSAVVPYEVAGFVTANVQIRYAGQTSNAVTVVVATTAPGLFTANSSGTGPGAILNGNNTTNSPGNPADRGGVAVLYLTGEGQTSPAGVTGKVTTVSAIGPLTPEPLLPIGVLIDGQPAGVVFKGEAPTFVSGVLQLNVQIPLTARAGDVSVVVTIGGSSSQSGVTISLR